MAPTLMDLENVEARATADFARAAPDALARTLGIALLDCPGFVAVRAIAVDALTFNRALGFGLTETPSEALLDQAISFCTSAGASRFMVQPSPGVPEPGLSPMLLARGFTCHNFWAKLYRGTENAPDVQSAFRVEVIDTSGTDDFAAILSTGFGLPDEVRPWIASAVGRSGWRHYLAFDGAQPIATGVLYVHEDVGWLGMAATAAAWRGRGAQSALIAARVRDAGRLGCRLVVSETAHDRPERPAPSFHNLRRLGFELAYLRPNFVSRSVQTHPGD